MDSNNVSRKTIHFFIIFCSYLALVSPVVYSCEQSSCEWITGDPTPENTLIVTNETFESFCKDFSMILNDISLDWEIISAPNVPEDVRDNNLILIGTTDAEYIGDVISGLISQEELGKIHQKDVYSIVEIVNPWAEDKFIVVCSGHDRVLTKKAAEEAMREIINSSSYPGEWTNPVFPSATANEIREYIASIQYLPEDELPVDAMRMEIDPKAPASISLEAAKEDLEYLFYLFSHGYCGYVYFNNSDEFEKARSNILFELEKKQVWPLNDYLKLINENLSFIHDCHLSMGDYKYRFCDHKLFWHVDAIDIWKSQGDYYFNLDSIDQKIISVNGNDPEEFMFPSLNASGEPIYIIGILSSSVPGPMVVIAQGNDVQRSYQFQADTSSFYSNTLFKEEVIGGIPVIRVRSFSDGFNDELCQFVQNAKKYKGEPYLLVDIRGNGGGNSRWPRSWVASFTGIMPSSVLIFTELISKTTMVGRANYFEYLLDLQSGIDESYYLNNINTFLYRANAIEDQTMSPYWSPFVFSSLKEIPNDTTLIVVMDGNVGSAGEGFISNLKQVENVIFIGENSNGALTFGQMSRHQLPNSKIDIHLPTSLNIFLDLEHREEMGFSPDIWVPAEDALNYAIAAARNGTITTLMDLPDNHFEQEFIPETVSSKGKDRIERVLIIITISCLFILTINLLRKMRTWPFNKRS